MSARPMKLEIYRATWHEPDDDPDYLRIVERHGWRWRIRATNGRVLADSGEAYGRLRDCAHGAELVTGFHLHAITPASDYIAAHYDLDGSVRGKPYRIVVDK